jgi:hypothetical protein
MYDSGKIFGGALENVTSTTVPPDSTRTINDLADAGTQLIVTGDTGGVRVEAASYIGPPPGAQTITTPSITGVGKYLDVQLQGSLVWPIKIRIYFTKNDLLQAGIVKSDLQGIYYWSGITNKWIIYSNSGSDDQGRGPSTTSVDTTNITINGVNYEGCVLASVYHLTPFTIGAKKKIVNIGAKEEIDIPTKYSLSPNYPNPFNPSTIISYQLPENSFVTLKVYDVLGREVKTLVDKQENTGTHSALFNAGNLPSGIYFCRMQAGGFNQTIKLILLK